MIAMVCLGNICRSPMAQVVLSDKVDAGSLAGRVLVTSAGTGDWHVGNEMDRRAAVTLSAHGYDPSAHRAEQFTVSWFDDHDLIMAMDRSNHRNIGALAVGGDTADRIRLFRSFDPLAGDDLEVPDPWYGGQGGFDDVFAMIERTTDEIARCLDALLSEFDSPST